MNLPWKVWVLIQRDQFLRDRRPQKVKRSLSFGGGGGSVLNPIDLLINQEFLETLCECDQCQKDFALVLKTAKAFDDLSDDDVKL